MLPMSMYKAWKAPALIRSVAKSGMVIGFLESMIYSSLSMSHMARRNLFDSGFASLCILH